MTPEEKIAEAAAEAEREIGEILKPQFSERPQGGRFGTGAPPPPVFRPSVAMVAAPETPPAEPSRPEPIPETMAKYHAAVVELIGLVSLNIGDLEERLNRRLAEIERVLGVKS